MDALPSHATLYIHLVPILLLIWGYLSPSHSENYYNCFSNLSLYCHLFPCNLSSVALLFHMKEKLQAPH